MTAARVIDVDSHVEEPEEAWAALEPAFAARRPTIVTAPEGALTTKQDAFWLVDGRLHPNPQGPGRMFFGTPAVSSFGQAKATSYGSQTLLDPAARLRDMDAEGLDVQVLFSTVFLSPLTEDVAFQAALMRSWNTWMAGVCRYAPERLKWAALLPLQSPPAAVEELRRVKELGAACVAIFGTAGGKLLHEPEFDPFYAEAARLDLPVCIHTGWSHPGLTASCRGTYAALLIGFSLPPLMGFFSIVGGGVLDRHPGLRVAFYEAGADWLPYYVQRMDQYWLAHHRIDTSDLPARKPSEYLRDGRIFFTCEGDEELLPRVIAMLGEDQVMLSADMPHVEARENSFQEIRERGDLTEAVKAKIIGGNAERFLGLR
ncbi:MAG TPA: amidohydrolase family protein [Chloroflexota bacterium]|nr:amidohydrolase family protein [Chloroflexota bacterium]